MNASRVILGKLKDVALRLHSHLLQENGQIVAIEHFFDVERRMLSRRHSLGRFKGVALTRRHRIEYALGARLEQAATAVIRIKDVEAETASALNKISTEFVAAGKALAGGWAEALAVDRFFDSENLERFARFVAEHSMISIRIDDNRSIRTDSGWIMKPFRRPDLPKLSVNYDLLH